MPRDQRLYMTFPNDFPWHPKVQRLTPAVKWAFVEMNGYSRMNDLDGRIPAGDAEFMWKPAVLNALVNSHPLRPLVVREGDVYVIRDYAEHQQTKAERDRLHTIRAEAGAKGGQARAKQLLSKPEQTQAESESRVRVQSSEPTSYVSESSPAQEARAIDPTKNPLAQSLKHGYNVDAVRVQAAITAKAGRDVSLNAACAIALDILGRAQGEVKSPQAYVLGSISRSWAEIQQHIDNEGTQ